MPTHKLNTQLTSLFLEEVKERTSEMERILLLLEKASDPAARQDARAGLLKIVHSLKGAAGLMEMRSIEAACHRIEDLLAQAGEQEVGPAMLDLLLAATDAIAATGRMMEQGRNAGDGELEKVVERLSAAIAFPTGEKSGEIAAKKAARSRLRNQKELSTSGGSSYRTGEAPNPSSGMEDALRVPAERLDSLLYRSNELLMSRSRSHARTEQIASLRAMVSRMRGRWPYSHSRLARGAISRELAAGSAPGAAVRRELALLERELRDLEQNLAADERQLNSTATSLDAEVYLTRMQPFAQACQGLNRMVRDISLSQGKSAEFAINGGGVEIDRSILAALHDPLRHLVRNAIDHGIERPAERRAAGKPEQGRITVSASLFGDRVQVRVQDDGGGIDLSSLNDRTEKEAEEDATDRREEEMLGKIFLPGVSTAPSVTRLSGRGVGLDIVRSTVERLRGRVEVAHVRGGGTTFTLTLPLTIAAFRALLVTAGEQMFALDASSIQRLIRIAPEDVRQLNGRCILLSENRSIPMLDLGEWLGIAKLGTASASPSTAVILGSEGAETAVLLEHVAGEQELLVRSLGARLAQFRSYSGGAILSDGRIALILNAAALAEAAAEGEEGLIRKNRQEQAPANKRLLVVDDSRAIRALGKLILESAGYEVVMAADGAEAWAYLQQHGADAVIADVDMPLMDGFVLTRKIRDSDKFKNLPVVLVTARETLEDKERGLHLGADAYLTKSAFDQKQLLDTIRQLV